MMLPDFPLNGFPDKSQKEEKDREIKKHTAVIYIREGIRNI